MALDPTVEVWRQEKRGLEVAPRMSEKNSTITVRSDPMLSALRCRSTSTLARMGSRHCSYKGPPLAPHSRPSEATVKRLAAEAEMQQKMWDLFVPEGGIRFGDRRFWVLLSIVLGAPLPTHALLS